MHVDGSARACSSMRTVRPMESGYAANAPQKASASHARSSPNAETTPSNMLSYTGFGAVALHATGPWRGAEVRDQKAITVKVGLTGHHPQVLRVGALLCTNIIGTLHPWLSSGRSVVESQGQSNIFGAW